MLLSSWVHPHILYRAAKAFSNRMGKAKASGKSPSAKGDQKAATARKAAGDSAKTPNKLTISKKDKSKANKKLSSGQKEAMLGSVDAAAMDLRTASVHKLDHKKAENRAKVEQHAQKKHALAQQAAEFDSALDALSRL